jgi:hypothetical protein
MSKLDRQVGAALRKLKKAKNSGETQRILADLRVNKPDVYKAIQNLPGN